MNLIIHTEHGGELIAEIQPEVIRVVATDHGPGIADIEQAMEPGFSQPRPTGYASWVSARVWASPISRSAPIP